MLLCPLRAFISVCSLPVFYQRYTSSILEVCLNLTYLRGVPRDFSERYRQMSLLEWSGKWWRATHASRRRDGTGALTFPQTPSAPPLEERKGEDGSPRTLPMAPVCSLGGSGRGNVQRGDPHFPDPSRAALGAARPAEGTDGGMERRPPNAMVADARYEPHEKSEFLIMLLEAYYETRFGTRLYNGLTRMIDQRTGSGRNRCHTRNQPAPARAANRSTFAPPAQSSFLSSYHHCQVG